MIRAASGLCNPPAPWLLLLLPLAGMQMRRQERRQVPWTQMNVTCWERQGHPAILPGSGLFYERKGNSFIHSRYCISGSLHYNLKCVLNNLVCTCLEPPSPAKPPPCPGGLHQRRQILMSLTAVTTQGSVRARGTPGEEDQANGSRHPHQSVQHLFWTDEEQRLRGPVVL